MTQMKIGDRVYIRGLVHSDCIGLTGTILDVRPSALFGPRIQRCKVDFNGKIRSLLNIHLTHATRRQPGGCSLTAA
jgi:hypothetical protein